MLTKNTSVGHWFATATLSCLPESSSCLNSLIAWQLLFSLQNYSSNIMFFQIICILSFPPNTTFLEWLYMNKCSQVCEWWMVPPDVCWTKSECEPLAGSTWNSILCAWLIQEWGGIGECGLCIQMLMPSDPPLRSGEILSKGFAPLDLDFLICTVRVIILSRVVVRLF